MFPARPNQHSVWLPHSMLWLDMIDPDYNGVSALDLVTPMSRIMRFTAQLPLDVQTFDASLLVHSWFVGDILENVLGVTDEQVIRTGMLHDAHEALCQDVSGPMKLAMRRHDPLYRMFGNRTSDYDAIEIRHKIALARRFDTLPVHPPEVIEADRLALACEMVLWFGEDWYNAEGRSMGEASLVPPSVIRWRKQCTIEGFLIRLGEPKCLGCTP